MSPGVNGTGRSTGTVPKTKPYDPTRDYPGAQRREHALNHVSNNLASLDWQPVSESGHSRTRKTSNTRSSTLEYHDFASNVPHSNMDVADPAVSQDNSRFTSTLYVPVEHEQQMSWSMLGRHSQDMTGQGCSAPVRKDPQVRRTPRNVLPDKENKSNISKMPDRNQVASRLNQIREYIKQTSSLMDTLKNSGNPLANTLVMLSPTAENGDIEV
uniref:Uncharacterized protein n=1 Tax=Timema douglasi TaxID=61478 RepID=A0A7R8VDE2_TIMDO|nr:unnamed protein product [Timema douglasi]